MPDNTEEFKTIEIYSNWCYCDSIGGKLNGVLKDKDNIEIMWADGTIEKIIVKVVEVIEQYYGHGGIDRLPITKAFVQKEIHGTLVDISLLGFKSRRIK